MISMSESKKEEEVKRKVFSVPRDQLVAKSNFLYVNKMPFTLVTSGSANELYSDIWNFKSTDKTFEVKNMNFVKKVKKYAIDNYVAMKFIGSNFREMDIQYVSVKKDVQSGDTFEDICCLDIKNAYWQTAFLMGVISKEIYEEGVTKDKITRLASLGSLAKKKEVFRFDGENYRMIDTIRNYETENIWFAICHRVSEIMKVLVSDLGGDFLFYWVDGIYFKRTDEHIKKVTDFLESCSYECKFEDVSKVEFFDDKFLVYSKLGRSSKSFGWKANSKNAGKGKLSHLDVLSLLDRSSKILKEK